jgi:hypothetical protein
VLDDSNPLENRLDLPKIRLLGFLAVPGDVFSALFRVEGFKSLFIGSLYGCSTDLSSGASWLWVAALVSLGFNRAALC